MGCCRIPVVPWSFSISSSGKVRRMCWDVCNTEEQQACPVRHRNLKERPPMQQVTFALCIASGQGAHQ